MMDEIIREENTTPVEENTAPTEEPKKKGQELPLRAGVRFSRLGRVRFVSHLDMQRLFSRALRRSGLPVRYSQGFNPHIVTSFASAMSVGLETEGDYLEFGVERPVTGEEICTALNNALPPAFAVSCGGMLEPGSPKLMAAVVAASYRVEGEGPFDALMQDLLKEETCVVAKVKKNKTKMVDIRPLILEAKEGWVLLKNSEEGTLSPNLLLSELERRNGEALSLRLVRQDLYTRINDELVPLKERFV